MSEALEAGHIGLLSSDQQAKLRETSLLIAGCGVGSVVAVAAARMGFMTFRVVDGDVVEPRNLNRQAYTSRDIGASKALALRDIILDINPDCQVDAVPEYVDLLNVDGLVSGMDIVVDAIDPTSARAVFALHRAASVQGKPLISPLDMGWGGMLQVFTPGSPSLAELAGVSDNLDLNTVDETDLLTSMLNMLTTSVPSYMKPVIDSYISGSITHFPQPVSGAMISSSMVVIAAMRLALGQSLKSNPEDLAFDPWLMHEEIVS